MMVNSKKSSFYKFPLTDVINSHALGFTMDIYSIIEALFITQINVPIGGYLQHLTKEKE